MTEGLDAWIGRRRETEERLDPARTQALLASLGHNAPARPGDALPQLFHWLYFWDVASPAETGPDGHPARGGFLPPVSAPRRMWAGGRLAFHIPLRLGDDVHRVSTISDIVVKSGRSGTLTFVTVRHHIHGPDGLAVTEDQDLVYRDASTGAPPTIADPAAPAEEISDWSLSVRADPILLFRYSALSMNSHRIHYDRPYAVDVEGYSDLVVQGPLQATLMLDAAVKAQGRPASGFQFRGLAPAFGGRDLVVAGKGGNEATEVWARQGGRETMRGVASFGEVR